MSGTLDGVAATAPARRIAPRKNGFWGWFIGVNLALLAIAAFFPFAVFFPLIGVGGAFVSLFLAKWLAKRAHGIRTIEPELFRSEADEQLYHVVADLASAAGLPNTPEVGVYKSPDINAFATGASRSKSIVAFSTGLLEKLSVEEIRAVAAHEVAHVANRDMLGIVLIQGVINSVVLALTAPINLLRVVNLFSDSFDWLMEAILWLAKVFVSVVLLFLGSLVSKAYSRRREFRADALAAELVGNAPLIAALKAISKDDAVIPRAQLAYAAFKISSGPSFIEIFSTHPAIQRRIAALRKLDGADVGSDDAVSAAAPVAAAPAVPPAVPEVTASASLSATAGQSLAPSPAPDRYATGLSKALAVMICAAGELEDGAFDRAVQFLEAEDAITDKAGAIETLRSLVEELRTEHAKSKPLFKLKRSKLIAQVRDEIVGVSRENSRVMLEGLLAGIKGSADPENRAVFNKLMTALAD